MKLKTLLAASLFAGALAFTGCANSTYGNEKLSNATEKSINQKIIKGKTTKAEIKQMFGTPSDVNYLPNNEQQWVYSFSKGKIKTATMIPIVGMFAGGTKSETKKLTIVFDKNGIVKDYMFITSKGETNTF